MWAGADWQPVRAEQQRIVLAILLTEAGHAIPAERLIDAVWGEQPPRTAAKTMQSYVLRLRRLLGDGVLVTRGHSYQVVVNEDDIDAMVFERLLSAARREFANGQPDLAAKRLADALALWRGPVLADVPENAALAARSAQLERLRLDAEEDRVDVLFDLGRPVDVVPDLQLMVDRSPLRERRWEQLIRALHHCGRRAEALEAYRRAHALLRDELGLEPGPRLRDLQRAILHDAPEEPPPRPDPIPRVVPAQLPTDVTGFVGREGHLKRLDGLLGETHPAAPTVVAVLAGMAGIGKTALAIRWAHRVRQRFSDGQLYANLSGYEPAVPRQPIEVLARFLAALGVPHDDIPVDVEEATALYRSLLADKQVLVLLDNARDPRQVRPLLPGGPGCVTLLTGRDRLTGLVARDGAVRLDLDVLTPEEAGSLLTRVLGPDRVAREAGSAAELTELCGYLPLALRIAAAKLLTHPHSGIADFVAQLRDDCRTALDLFDEPLGGVWAAFNHSYHSLPEPARRLLCTLGLVPGTDFTEQAAAALTGLPAHDANGLLHRLVDAHLVEPYAGARYGLHDLLRRYAADRASTDLSQVDRTAVLGQLYDYYLRGVAVAAQQLYPEMLRLPVPRTAGPTPALDDPAAALAWLDAERSNLAVAVIQASPALAPRTWRIADGLRGYLMTYRYVREWTDIGQAALAAAETDGDPHGLAAAHFSLGGLHWTNAAHDQAVEHYGTALALSRGTGWAEGEAAILGNLGLVHWTVGRLDEAAAKLAEALAVDEWTGRVASRATNLTNLGLIHGAQGRPVCAAARFTEALDCFRRAGSLGGEASVLANLGETYHVLGRLPEALDALRRALALNRRLGDRRSEAETTRFLAAVERDRGRSAVAFDLVRAAVAMGRDVGDGRCEAEALVVEASIRDQRGEAAEATAGYLLALARARRDGYQYTEAEALLGLAATRNHAREWDRAAEAATAGLDIVHSAGYRLLEGDGLVAMAEAELGRGRHDAALDRAGQAVAVQTRNGQRLGLARAHLASAAALEAAGRSTEATAHRHLAHTIADQARVTDNPGIDGEEQV